MVPSTKDNSNYGEVIPYTELNYADTEEKRASNIEAAKGLQAVDGLETSDIFDRYAEKYIKGEIASDTFVDSVKAYYLLLDAREEQKRYEGADAVAANLAAVLENMPFSFFPAQLQVVHKRLFEGTNQIPDQYLYDFRDYNFRKEELLLAKESVDYADKDVIFPMLEASFRYQERINLFAMEEKDVIESVSNFIAEIWQVHGFVEGNTRTTAVFAIQYFRSLGYDDINNDLFAENSLLFRNSLVRACYSNRRYGVQRDPSYLNAFFDSLVKGVPLTFRNRDMFCKEIFLAKGLADPFEEFAEYEKEVPTNTDNPFPVVEPGKAMTPAKDRAAGIRSAEAQKRHTIVSQNAKKIGPPESDDDHNTPK